MKIEIKDFQISIDGKVYQAKHAEFVPVDEHPIKLVLVFYHDYDEAVNDGSSDDRFLARISSMKQAYARMFPEKALRDGGLTMDVKRSDWRYIIEDPHKEHELWAKNIKEAGFIDHYYFDK